MIRVGADSALAGRDRGGNVAPADAGGVVGVVDLGQPAVGRAGAEVLPVEIING